MKGITPVIALILLLVIVIVIVGFSFGIFQSIISSGGQAAQDQTDTTTQNIQQTVRYEACAPGATGVATVTVRNMGSTDIAGSDVGVYVKGAAATCTPWTPASIPSSGVSTCTVVITGGIAAGDSIRVTSPSGASETQTC